MSIMNKLSKTICTHTMVQHHCISHITARFIPTWDWPCILKCKHMLLLTQWKDMKFSYVLLKKKKINLIKQRWVEWMEQVSFIARYRKTTSVQFISSDDLNTLKVLTSQLPQRGNETFFWYLCVFEGCWRTPEKFISYS